MPLPSTLEPETTLLFLGSGFSSEATNIAGAHPPIGRGLAEEFERQLGVPSGELDLKSLSDEMYHRSPGSLYQTLYNLFRISALSTDQQSILSKKWLRVFTTNYDDAVELGSQSANLNLASYSHDDPIPSRISTGSIVHIHGAITKANEDNILDQLVLNENSYIRQHFEKSAWYGELDRALDHCSACFFVGYSLSDYHITSLLLQKLSRKAKTFFIVRSMPNDVAKRQLEQFGEIHPIGIGGFANLVQSLPRPNPVRDLNSLRAVWHVDPFRDQRSILAPTSQEILRLVTYGEFNFQRCLTTLPAPEYVAPRQTEANKILEELVSAKTLLLHSYLGNGKSIFTCILSYNLHANGYNVFICKSDTPTLVNEIAALRDLTKVVIIFDSYDLAIQTISQFESEVPDTKYIVTVRTGIQDVRLHEVHLRLPGPVRRVSLNSIHRNDKNELAHLLDKAGVLGGELREHVNRGGDFREIVTKIYNHQGIRQRIASETESIFSDSGTKDVFLSCLLLSWIGQTFEPALLKAVTGRDPYVELRKYEEISSEIFRIDEDILEVRSPLFGEYLLQNHTEASDIISTVEKILLVAVERKRERSFGGILSKLMRVSTLKHLMAGTDSLSPINDMFQRLQRDIHINSEPLFWLQYAILSSERESLPEAEHFLETAYDRAANSPGFETYQIDTYALRLLLKIEGVATTPSVERLDKIFDKLDLVISMLGQQSHRWYAIQVLSELRPFVLARHSAMTMAERNGLVFQLNRVTGTLGSFSPEIKAETGSESIRASVEEAIRALL